MNTTAKPQPHADKAETADLKWDLRQRLKLLEGTLLLTGWVRTQALIEAFGISRAQASKDFAAYMALRPQNLTYNRSRKYYEVGDGFQPLLLKGHTAELLDLLKATATEGDDPDHPVLALAHHFPPVALLHPAERHVDLNLFRLLSQATFNRQTLRIDYQSLNRDVPATRTLSPHTLVYNGYRWHVRAWSEEHGEFRDFVLSRFRGKPELIEKPGPDSTEDTAWQTDVELVIAPHPDLNPTQRAVITDDYGMIDGRLTLTLRAALLPYQLRLMQIDPDQEHPDPKAQQIVAANRETIAPWLWSQNT